MTNEINNSTALSFFENMASNNPSEKDVRIYGKNDYSLIDAEFIMRFCDQQSDVLDLGSGSGLLVNKIYRDVRSIVAVEKFKEFSKFIVNAPNVQIINTDIAGFESGDMFDVITLFGVVHYFNKAETTCLYRKYLRNLKPNGRLIIKSQFGVYEDVNVSGFSEELQQNYYSQYRHLDGEIKLLKEVGFNNIDIVDIYPPECNRWDNTHFYAIVAQK